MLEFKIWREAGVQTFIGMNRTMMWGRVLELEFRGRGLWDDPEQEGFLL